MRPREAPGPSFPPSAGPDFRTGSVFPLPLRMWSKQGRAPSPECSGRARVARGRRWGRSLTIDINARARRARGGAARSQVRQVRPAVRFHSRRPEFSFAPGLSDLSDDVETNSPPTQPNIENELTHLREPAIGPFLEPAPRRSSHRSVAVRESRLRRQFADSEDAIGCSVVRPQVPPVRGAAHAGRWRRAAAVFQRGRIVRVAGGDIIRKVRCQAGTSEPDAVR